MNRILSILLLLVCSGTLVHGQAAKKQFVKIDKMKVAPCITVDCILSRVDTATDYSVYKFVSFQLSCTVEGAEFVEISKDSTLNMQQRKLMFATSSGSFVTVSKIQVKAPAPKNFKMLPSVTFMIK